MEFFKMLLFLSPVFKPAFGVETTVHLSTSVASSVCSQHENYLSTQALQSPVTSRPQSDSETAECEWLTIPKSPPEPEPGTAVEISRRLCDQVQTQGQEAEADADGADGSGRIVGGEATEPHEFPTLVAIFFLNRPPSDDYRRFLCGGSVLSENWILTAAHCLDLNKNPQNYRIVAGAYKVSNNASEITEPAQIRDIDRFIKHPNYTKDKIENGHDIGLMHLTEPFVLDDKVQKLNLPPPGYQPSKGSQVTAVGRGRTSGGDPASQVPIKANFTVVSEEGCKKALIGKYAENFSDTIICARIKAENDRDTCFGDSGSLLLYYGEDGVPVQIGVIAFGAGSSSGERADIQPRSCAQWEAPFGSTNVAKVLDWISESSAES